MLSSTFDRLFGTTPTSFAVNGSPEDGVRRLAPVVKSLAVRTMFREGLIGKVTVERVAIRRHHPFHNDFAPRFVGRFVSDAKGTVLTGGFRIGVFPRAFMALWFGFIVVWTIAAMVSVITGYQIPEALLPVAGIAMLVTGIVFVRLLTWLSRSDVSYITGTIEKALSGDVDV